MTHPTMQRVFDATNKTPTEIAETISTKPQNINNWANRGISKSGALEIGKAFGLSVDELLYEFAHTDELYFDMEQMTQAIDSPSVEVPKTALKDLASFERFLKENFA